MTRSIPARSLPPDGDDLPSGGAPVNRDRAKADSAARERVDDARADDAQTDDAQTAADARRAAAHGARRPGGGVEGGALALRDAAQRARRDAAERARRRVSPLAPQDRRATLIEATIPLLLEHGSAISSRQIAQAAGVAEGTIFRVYPDKNSLILDALKHALDPQPGVDAFRAIPSDLDLRERMLRAATGLITGITRFGRLHMIAREVIMDLGPASDFSAHMHKNNLRVQEALATVFEPDRERLRLRPANAARLLLLTVIGMSGLPFGEVQRLDPAEIVSVLLDGIVKPDDTARETATPAASESAHHENVQAKSPKPSDDRRSTKTDEHSDSRPGTSRES